MIKVASPNALLQTVLVEAAAHFGVDPRLAALRVRKTTLDCSQPIRFSNLSNNATVDLVLLSAPTQAGSSSASSVLPPSSSSAAAGAGPYDASKNASCRVALSIEGGGSFQGSFPIGASMLDIIRSCASQGLLPGDILSLSPQVVYMRSTVNTDQLAQASLASLGISSGQGVRLQLRFVAGGQPLSAIASTPTTPTVAAESAPNQHAAAPTPVEEKATDALSEGEPMDVSSDSVHPLAVSPPPPPVAPPATSHPAPVLDQISHSVSDALLPSVNDCIQFVLAQNFDAASVPALLTIGRYLANVLSNPSDQRVRAIPTTNKVFVEKVLPVRGAVDLLSSIGFQPSGQQLVLQADTRISAAWDLLAAAYETLAIPDEKRPALKPPAAVEAAPFDPFKTIVTSLTPQVAKTGGSATESELTKLAARRAELEGLSEHVQRETHAVLPSSQSSAAPSKAGAAPPVEEESNGLPLSALKRLGAAKEEDAPLTTQALRDLQRAQKERVYSRSLVRVRFPDRVELVGYFHPRHLLADVYSWVAQSVGWEGDALTAFLDLFELSLPPRSVLPPYPSINMKKRRVDGQEGSRSLGDLQLVPACVLNLSWRSPRPTETPGSYLVSSIRESASTESHAVVPSGVRLVEPSAAAAEEGQQVVAVGEAKAENKPRRGQPKWLKV